MGDHRARAETVFEVNSYAVVQLQHGRYEPAIQKLREAAAELLQMQEEGRLNNMPPRFILNNDMVGYGSQADNPTLQEIMLLSASVEVSQRPRMLLLQQQDPQGHNSSMSSSSSSSSSSTTTSNVEGDQARTEEPQDTNVIQMYERTFCTLYLNHAGPRGFQFTNAFVLYNLALCYHHREFTEQLPPKDARTQVRNLNMALRLYEAAWQVIRGAPDGDCRPADLMLLTLAVLNNMAHINCHLCNVPAAKWCIQALRATVSAGDTTRHIRTQPDIAFFMTLAVMPPEFLFSKAPAA